jgi:carnosine N-methyltransferase
VDKVQSTLKQFVRDWSAEGRAERDMCYKPIMDRLLSLYGSLPRADRGQVKVLVPGAGLGRLAFNVALQGFECQGNEFSLYMLMAANYVLNRCAGAVGGRQVHPWIHQFTNVMSSEDQLRWETFRLSTKLRCPWVQCSVFRSVSFPDVDPASLPEGSCFSMAAGDFLEVYAEPEYQASQVCIPSNLQASQRV